MASHYQRELGKLDSAYRAAMAMDVSRLAASVERWAAQPMLMVGSGGSFSVAKFAADLHERVAGQLARAATPLEIMSKEGPAGGLVCFSASGRNQDIVAAFRAAATRESEPLGALVLREGSALEAMVRRFRYADMVCMAHPSFRDGFLAVGSLIGSAVLLARSYRAAYGRSERELPRDVSALVEGATSFADVEAIVAATDRLIAGREYLSVIYGPVLAAAAVDLESRFVEASLGAMHVADLRSFGHGRHFWMARRGRETAVAALIPEQEDDLATRTISLLPNEVARLLIRFRGAEDVQGIAGLVVAVVVASRVARVAHVDPGRPGVPPFGRKLYRLKRNQGRPAQGLVNRDAALRRKRAPVSDGRWIEHYERAFETVNAARYEGLVVDYDGTLCDTRDRRGNLPSDIAEELTRIAEEGAAVGVATGRGASAGAGLRATLPGRLHDRVLVGYYNGAVIRSLEDEEDPALASVANEDALLAALAKNPMLSGRVRSNGVQISTSVARGVRLAAGAEEVALVTRAYGVEADVVVSGHSIDVCTGGQSKEDLVDAMRERFGLGAGPILRIGDRGRAPGNDWRLLDSAHGLSVDQVSRHPVHCWSLAPAGAKGTQATIHYLRRLRWTRSGGRIRLSPAARA